MQKLCIVTGSRAEYGLLSPLMKAIQSDPGYQLQILATGSHFSPKFGSTYQEIEKDGFTIDEKIDTWVEGDSARSTAKSIGLGVNLCAEALDRLKPDLMIVLGDRFEIFAAVQAAYISQIPVAHLCGGDTTEGAFDEGIRHSITKMSHLHFVSNDESLARVKQLGENPAHIQNVGSPAYEKIRSLKLLSRSEFEKETGFSFRAKNLIVTFHPATLDPLEKVGIQIQELLKALGALGPDFGILFTKSNADPGGELITRQIEQFVASHPSAKAYSSLGQLKYFSALSQVDLMVGNSSSGIYEMPFFKKPTINIGDRQKGRLQTASVINCEPKQSAIFEAIQRGLKLDLKQIVNPYGGGNTSELILKALKKMPDFRSLLQKHFFSN